MPAVSSAQQIDNDTWKRDDDRYYVPLDKADDTAILDAGLRFAHGSNQEHFTSTRYVPAVARTVSADPS